MSRSGIIEMMKKKEPRSEDAVAVVPGTDGLGVVESHGIDYIPLSERHSSPWNLFTVMTGQAFFLGNLVIGWLLISYGLGWWSSVSAILIGNAVGALIICPVALLGPRTGTNGPVSSGAFFGVVGRIIGTVVSLFTAIGFAALAVWTSGQAVIAGMNRLVGLPMTTATYAIAYAVIALICFLVALYGHANVVAAQKFLVAAVGLLMIVGTIIFASKAKTGYTGGHYILTGGFWPTWSLAVATTAALPISLAPYVNDYARYVSTKFSDRRITGSVFLGCAGGVVVTMLFGVWTAIGFKNPTGDYVSNFVSTSPEWFVVPIVLIGLLGGCGQAAFSIYGVGLDTSSLIPKLNRVTATTFIGIITIAFVYIADFVLGAINTVNSFVLLLIVLLVPWTMVVIIGHFARRGYYKPDDLQVFNQGKTGGIYWFTGGLNWRAVIAYVAGAAVGCMFINTSLFTGPWSDLANGVDLSTVSALVVTAVVYSAALLLFPEPADVKAPAAPAPEGINLAEPETPATLTS